MNRKNNMRSQRLAAKPNTRLSPVALAVYGVLCASGSAMAQQAADDKSTQQVDAIVVTGFRQSIETSIAKKRESNAITEIISAEDLGKLPDTSIAEALARLPGLTAQRVDGRAQSISIRGLASNYAGSLLNGRSVVSTSDSRAVEFDQFPSELLSGVTVYKTPDAGLIGQGLSGTVDLHTVRPLDFKGRQMAFNVRGEKNSNGKLTSGADDIGNRLSASYINQFANNTIGIALGYAHLDSPGQEQHYKSWWWANTGEWGRPVVGAPAGAVTLNGFEATVTASQQKRDGLMGVLEFKPNKDLHSVVDLYYSKFDQNRTMRGIMSNLGPTWNDSTEPRYTNPSTTNVSGDRILTGGTISNLSPVVRNDYNTRTDKVTAAGWNTEMKLGEWKAIADLSYSKSKRNEQILETYAGLPGSGAGSFNVDIATGSGVSQFRPNQNYAGSTIVLSDPAGWGHDGLIKYPKVEDEIKSMRLSGRHALPRFFSSVEIGGDYSERTKSVNKDEYNVNLKNGRAPITVPSNLLVSPTSLSYAGIPGVLSYDVMGALGSLYNLTPTGQDQTFARHYDINEKVTTAYLKLDIDSDFAGIPIRGNVGLQSVKAKQFSHGFAWTGKDAVPIGAGKNYTDVLPSLNLVAEFKGDRYLRLGVAKTLARPRMEDMRAGFTGIGIDTVSKKWSASGGNPGLEPWRADSYDISFEQYFGKRSYVSVAGFTKQLHTFIYNKTIDYDFTGFPNTTGVVPISNIGTLSAPANGKGGNVDGVELAASLEANLLTPALDGFGVIGSYSQTHSSLHEDNNTSKPLDGLSGEVTTATVYYEKYGFSARVSQRYRSKFETKTRGVFLDSITSKIEAERQLDMQLGYAFERGAWKGLSILLQVNNMTNEPYRTRVGIDAGSANVGSTMPERYTTYGRTILLGINYKM